MAGASESTARTCEAAEGVAIVAWEWAGAEVRFVPSLAALLGGDGGRTLTTAALGGLVHPEERALAAALAVDLREAGGSVIHDLRMAAAGGEWRTIRVTAVAEPAEGSLRGTAVVVRPPVPVVDARGFAADLFTRAEWGLAVGSTAAMRVEACNPAFARARGYSPEELVGHSVLDLVAPEARAACLAEVARAHRVGHHIFQSVHLRRDGSTFPVVVELTMVRDDAGAPIRRLVRVEDLSSYPLADALIRVARFRGIFEHSPIAIFIYSVEGRLEEVNPAGLEILGVDDAEALASKSLWDNPNVTPAMRARLDAGEVVHLQSTFDFDRVREVALFPTRRRGIAVIEWVLAPIAGMGYMVQLVEITARVRAEVERERLAAELARARKLETVGRLAGGLAHEFNNILAVISMRAELALGSAPAGSPLRRHLDGIVTTSGRAVESLRHLLGFARRRPSAPVVLDLGAALTAMAPMLRRLLGEGIALEVAVQPGLWPVFLEPGQLDQVVVNLCLNSRAALGGVGRISIRAANRDEGGVERVSLVIGDDGPGMSQDALDHLYEPFFTTKPVGEGAGLGLATVRAIVQQSGGEIAVESGVAGTIVRITLPRCSEAPSQAEAEVRGAPAAGRGETLLFVEDREDLREATREALEGLGYRVLAPSSPKEALRVAAEHEGALDLLVTDVIMPEIDGPTLHRLLEARRPGLPVVYVSGQSVDRSGRVDLVAAGVEVLRKPFTLVELASRIRARLGDQGPPERVT